MASSLIFRITKWLVIAFFAISALFPPITLPILSSWGEEHYRREFDSSQRGTVVMSLDEWADTFAGSFGLGHLEELSHDPQLKPSGRKIAVEISDYISSGQHQAQLLSALKEHWYVWPISCDLLCIYVADGIRSGHWTTGPKSYDLEFPH